MWLLAEHGHWLEELQRTQLVDADADGSSRIAWRQVTSACLYPRDSAMIGTLSEWQILRLACVLTGRHALSLADLDSLDETNKRLALHAVAWAAGGRAWADSLALLPA